MRWRNLAGPDLITQGRVIRPCLTSARRIHQTGLSPWLQKRGELKLTICGNRTNDRSAKFWYLLSLAWCRAELMTVF